MLCLATLTLIFDPEDDEVEEDKQKCKIPPPPSSSSSSKNYVKVRRKNEWNVFLTR